jgi:hypothetical protein
VLHEGKSLSHGLIIVVAAASKTAKTVLSLLEFTTADKVPGTLGGEESDGEQRRNPHPLQTVGDTPASITLEVERATEDTSGEETSGSPAHGNPGCKVTTEGSGANFGGVGGGESLEDTPWDTTEEVTDEEHFDVDGEEEDEDGAGHESHGEHVNTSRAISLLKKTVEQKTKDRTTVVSSTNSTLPLCRNMLLSISIGPAEPVKVGIMSEEVVDETDIHSLHDQRNTQTHTKGHSRPIPGKQLLLGDESLCITGSDGGFDEFDLGVVARVLCMVDREFAAIFHVGGILRGRHCG